MIRAVEKFDWRKGSSSPPTPPGGSVRRSHGDWAIRQGRSAAGAHGGCRPNRPGHRASRCSRTPPATHSRRSPTPGLDLSGSKRRWRHRATPSHSTGRLVTTVTPSYRISSRTSGPGPLRPHRRRAAAPALGAGSLGARRGREADPPPVRLDGGEPALCRRWERCSTSPGSGSVRLRAEGWPSSATRPARSISRRLSKHGVVAGHGGAVYPMAPASTMLSSISRFISTAYSMGACGRSAR